MKIFKDSHLLSPAATYFRTHGIYTHAIKGTKEYRDFWKEERRRCLEGYEVNGTRITGYHYHYLNFFRIDRAIEEKIGKRVIKKREYDFPDFYDSDYDFFWVCEIARKGIEPEDYEKLQLGVEIHPDDLAGGKQVVVLKARRKGYSYKVASMLARNYFHMKRSKNFVMAFDKKYLTGDGIYQKFLDGLAFIDENTAFTQPRLASRPTDMVIKSGYKIVKDGTEIDKGFQSLVLGISLKDNPDGARGKAGELVVFEEMGKFPGLKKAWEVTHHTVKEGTDALGLMIAFGTGGTEDADFSGAEELFGEPEENDAIRINNQWDDGSEGTHCGFFVPIYRNLRGFIDKDGNSKVEEAIEYELEQREKKRKSRISSTYSQYVAETPFKPSEAILSVDLNLFPTQQLNEQYNSVKVHKRYNFGANGFMHRGLDGKAKFKVDIEAKPVYKFPHTKEDDTSGCIVVYEAPHKTAEGSVPDEMYIVCHDPYAHDKTTGAGSLGAAYVIKRSNHFSHTFNDCIVASYVGRPQTQDDYNEQLFMLAEYYNAKIGFENDRGDVIGYARRYKKLHLLEEEFKFMDKKELQGNTRRAYGMNMTEGRIYQAEIYIRDWLSRVVQSFEDDKKILILNTILDPALLQELMKYNAKGNFDRVSALMVGMYHLKEKFNKAVKEAQDSRHEEFFNRPWFT